MTDVDSARATIGPGSAGNGTLSRGVSRRAATARRVLPMTIPAAAVIATVAARRSDDTIQSTLAGPTQDER